MKKYTAVNTSLPGIFLGVGNPFASHDFNLLKNKRARGDFSGSPHSRLLNVAASPDMRKNYAGMARYCPEGDFDRQGERRNHSMVFEGRVRQIPRY